MNAITEWMQTIEYRGWRDRFVNKLMKRLARVSPVLRI